MRFRHPLVLLLGGLLSAGSVGCSAVTAVVSDTRPAARQGRGSADKYAAIARVYENQGRYDQAEAMYRRALKQNPNNSEVKNSLQILANRKAGRNFGSEAKTEAVAKADAAQNAVVEQAVAMNAKAPAAMANLKATAESELKTASLELESLAGDSTAAVSALAPASFEESSAEMALSKTSNESSERFEVTEVDDKFVAVGLKTGEKAPSPLPGPVSPLVSAEQILAVVDTPGEHAELLLNGLKHGDSLETQCLAATLLGDCDRSDTAIRDALQKANKSATDAYLRLAISDSRIQRGEHDDVTAQCLIRLLSDAPADLQIQVCSSMHHFVSTASESACITALESALSSNSADLRAGAAVALGDFPRIPASVKARLEKMASSDAETSVREAAMASLDRDTDSDDFAETEILVVPQK